MRRLCHLGDGGTPTGLYLGGLRVAKVAAETAKQVSESTEKKVSEAVAVNRALCSEGQKAKGELQSSALEPPLSVEEAGAFFSEMKQLREELDAMQIDVSPTTPQKWRCWGEQTSSPKKALQGKQKTQEGRDCSAASVENSLRETPVVPLSLTQTYSVTPNPHSDGRRS